MSISSGDELDHRSGPSSAWSETWEFRGCSADLSLGIAVAVVRRPAEGQMSYRAIALGRWRPPIVVVDHEIDPPRHTLEIRGSGIWADHTCEQPHVHWSFGLEAFGLALDDPSDLIVTGRGLSVPLGFDLEWEATAPPVAVESEHDEGYTAIGVTHGEVLVADDTLVLDGVGARVHRWGTGPAFPVWWEAGAAAALGNAPWTGFDPVARVLTPDPFGVVADVSLGSALFDTGPVSPAWRSRQFDG